MEAHRKSDQRRDDLCAGGLRKPRVECTALGWSEREMAVGFYFPGGRYLTVFFVAWSTSSGVISTVARDATAPLALTANERAAASTLLGRSAMITKSLPPKA